MFPDLRLLISATVATFFLAAMAGLYASLRTQDQIVARTENRSATDDSPATRISSAWPLLPEPGRAAALRELARIANYSPLADRGGVNAAPNATQSGMPANEGRALDTTGSTGIIAPEAGAIDHPDVQGNIGNMPDMSKVVARTEKEALLPAKKVRPVAKKKVAIKRLIVSGRTPEQPVDLLNIGYPLYWTVPAPP